MIQLDALQFSVYQSRSDRYEEREDDCCLNTHVESTKHGRSCFKSKKTIALAS